MSEKMCEVFFYVASTEDCLQKDQLLIEFFEDPWQKPVSERLPVFYRTVG